MPPRLSLRTPLRRGTLAGRSIRVDDPSVCFFCSLSHTATPNQPRRPRRKALNSRRPESTSATARADPRKDLEIALLELQKHAANYVNLSRLQLALNGLRQEPGNEAIRVAIIGLANETAAGATAKKILKLLLADPLKEEEDWERQVDEHDLQQPMIVRIGIPEHQEPGTISLSKNTLLPELHVSSATLNGRNLEILITESGLYNTEDFENEVLVPTVEIPSSHSGAYSPVTTPVHKALIVADGIMGAAAVAALNRLPPLEGEGVIRAAVDLPGYNPPEPSDVPYAFVPVDVKTASVGLGLVRKSINHAMEYEHLWFESRMPKLAEWLKADIGPTEDGTTKPPVRQLIASVLQNAANTVEHAEIQHLSLPLTAKTSSTHLQGSLVQWAENAHTELQEQLDLAFSSRRWRKLGWWKLFWRVDDVHMISTDILNLKFLPSAEKNAIYLAGRIQEAKQSVVDLPVTYTAPVASNGTAQAEHDKRWPMNIPAARAYLQNETIPALQALAQNLVFQALGTSGLTTSLGALVYFGTLTTGLYEAGAVAALGIVWSLRNMQAKWEAARKFWEGEVREEGRKAVRGVELAVESVLTQAGDGQVSADKEELDKARQLIEKATEALKRL
ncbi:hypothetical protein BX600DRAFT_464069, partial [Xylariales sp. PMI_506]